MFSFPSTRSHAHCSSDKTTRSTFVIKQEEFVDAGYPGNRAWQLAPAFFFAGALLVWLLDKAVHNLHATPRDFAAADFRNRIIQSLSSSARKKNAQSCARKEWRSERECQQLHSHQQPGHKQQSKSDEDEENPSHSDQDNNARDENKEGSDERREEGSHHTSQSEQAAANGLANQKAASLGKLGILTALSIALHNLPEGAAVYIRWVYLCVNSYLEMHIYLHPVAQHLSLVLAVQLLAHPLALQ